MEIMPDVFQYHDYRQYLRDWFQHQKVLNPKFSQRTFAKQTNLSPSYLTMVLRGQTPLTIRALQSMESELKLNRQESHFLNLLVQLIEAKGLEEQRQVFKRLARLGLYRGQHPEMISGHYYYSNWYNVAIREMSQLPEFTADPHWIQLRLNRKVSLGDIRASLKFLMENKYINLDKMGHIKPGAKQLYLDGPLYKLALCEFYDQVLNKAIDAVYTVDRDNREYNSNTIAISKNSFGKVKNIIHDAMGKIEQVVKDDEGAEDVYHVMVVAFPFTAKKVVSE